MVEIILKNGSRLQIKSLQVRGAIVDSNGTPAGGETTYAFIESEVDALNVAVPLQAIYNAVNPPDEPAQEADA
ncbi:MAG: hypothetical protein IKO42_02870 [Opitutales bacterium]|nr:hypothetical protein [Opitutales bacterium]